MKEEIATLREENPRAYEALRTLMKRFDLRPDEIFSLSSVPVARIELLRRLARGQRGARPAFPVLLLDADEFALCTINHF